MKKLIIALMLLTATMVVHAQNRAIRTFYKQYQRSENVTKMAIPGFVIRMGGGIAKGILKNNEDFAEQKDALKLIPCIRGLRLLTIEDQPVSKEKNSTLVRTLKAGKFEELLAVRADGSTVHIMMREKIKKRKNKKIIKGLFILVNDGSQFTMVNLKTKIKPKHLDQMVQLIIDQVKDEEVVEKKEKKREQA